MSSESGVSKATMNAKSKDILLNLTAASQGIVGRFTCGGSLRPPAPITLWYITPTAPAVTPTPTSAAAAVQLPCLPASFLDPLLHACSPATFGLGNEAVLDPTVRKALQMAADRCASSFDLASTRILDDVRDVLLTPDRGVTAELYKLNIYGPGDHFKPHVDTPRGEDNFGSLVVCLPQPFVGGSLLVRHAGAKVVYDWATDTVSTGEGGCKQAADEEGGTAGDGSGNAASARPLKRQATPAGAAAAAALAQPATVQWAAFYSDCEHEIKPVVSGHRVTLTYLLRSHDAAPDSPRLVAADPHTLPLAQALIKALADPEFLPRGACLGLPCRHAYSFYGAGDVPRDLKGSDRVLWAALAGAGLAPRLEAQADSGFDEGLARGSDDERDEDEQGKTLMLEPYRDDCDLLNGEVFEGSVVGEWDWQDVVWVGRPGPATFYGAYATYGNEPGLEGAYASLALMVDVPSAVDRGVA